MVRPLTLLRLSGTLLFSAIARAGLDFAVVEPPEVVRAYAEAGDPFAQYNLALLHQKGEGVKQDTAQALAWYRKAAAGGWPEAQYNLGVILSQGDGVPQDEKEGAKWLYAAASQGVFAAQKALIHSYSRGIGVEQSAEKALTWDFLARRSLELHFEKSAGLPPKPAKLRADGFAEYVTPDGRREVLGPGPENADAGRVTKYPDGGTLTEFTDGRRMTKDRNGTIETRFPDGSRTLEGDGKTSRGESTRVITKSDKDGKTISQRFKSEGRWIELIADGTQFIEEEGEDEEGRKVRIVNRYDKSGVEGERRLLRDDGVEHKDEEIWEITHWTKQPDGTEARVRTKFGLANSVHGEEVLETKKPGAVAVPVKPIEKRTTETRTAIGDVMRPKADIAPQLAELAKLARESRYYAGVTDAQYERLRAAAEHFVFNLPTTPQKPGSPNNAPKQALADMTAPPPPDALREIASDRSDAVALGFYGRDAIKLHPWKHAETEHFVVHFTQSSGADPAMRYVECAFFAVARTLQLDPAAARRKMHVFVFPDAAAWRAFTDKQRLSPEIAGFACKDELLLAAHDEQDTRVKALCHEATHAIVAHFYPGRKWPLWLSEGFAETMSARTLALRRGHPTARYLAQNVPKQIDAARVFDRIRLGLAAPGLAGRTDVADFYGEAEKCVRVLIEQLPGAAFPRFANLAFAGNSIPACLREAYGEACGDTAKFQSLVNSTP